MITFSITGSQIFFANFAIFVRNERKTPYRFIVHNTTNKHFDACIYLPPYKLDVLKIVEYKFSCEMEAHVEVTTSKRHFNV